MPDLPERKDETIIRCIEASALLLASLAVLSDIPREYLFYGFMITAMLLLILLFKSSRRGERRLPDRVQLAQSVSELEKDLCLFQGQLSNCMTLFDLSRKTTSRVERVLQTFVTIYYLYVLSLFVSPNLGSLAGSMYGGPAFLFWVFLVILSLFLGKTYTSYVKLVSMFLAGGSSKRMVGDLIGRLRILKSTLMRLDTDTNVMAAVEKNVESSLVVLSRMSEFLEKVVQKIQIPRSVLEIFPLALPYSLLVQPLVNLLSGRQEMTVLYALGMVLIVIIGIAAFCMVPYHRADSGLRMVGLTEQGKKIQEHISNLEAMTLSTELLRLTEESFLFSEGSPNERTIA